MKSIMAKTFTVNLGLRYPIIQAAMAGVTTPEMVAEVCNNGALGSLPVSHINLSLSDGFLHLEQLIQQVRSRIKVNSAMRNINLNFFCHDVIDNVTEDQKENWFSLYKSATKFNTDMGNITFNSRAMSFKDYEGTSTFSELISFLRNKFTPKVVSFHFGTPSKTSIEEFQKLGILVFATATSVQEVKQAIDKGVNGIICQGYEAGGHRGNYIVQDQRFDEKLSTALLMNRITQTTDFTKDGKTFFIPAGGLGTPSDIKYMLSLGAAAVQLGTSFLATPESKVADKVKGFLSQDEKPSTLMTDLVSGKPARAILTPFLQKLISVSSNQDLPDYGFRYNAFKQLKQGQHELDFILAGQGYQSIKSELSISEILDFLGSELNEQ